MAAAANDRPVKTLSKRASDFIAAVFAESIYGGTAALVGMTVATGAKLKGGI